MDLADFGTVVESEEDEFENVSNPPKSPLAKKPSRTLKDKREEFRI